MSLRILKHSHWLVLLLMMFALNLSAQDLGSNYIISPSPTSSSSAKFSELPVDLSTGVPQINLPLYVIQSAKLSYPISLGYHASGVKVSEVAGSTGLGWNLNAGGMITRVVRGRPDESTNGYFSFASAIPNSTDPLTVTDKEDMARKIKDMMPDIFYFNTGLSAGKIIFDNQLNARSIPNQSIKVTPNSTSTLSKFTMADPQGTNYEFEAGESATVILGAANNVTCTASWYLARIVSADKLDTIRFNYSLGSDLSYVSNASSGILYYYDAPPGASNAAAQMQSISSSTSVSVSGTRYLTNIEYKGGRVDFSFSGGRTDDPNGKKLDRITIYHKDPVSGVIVEEKKINFTYSYFVNNDNSTRLRLDSFREQFASSSNPPYSFVYSAKTLPGTNSSAQDLWGYYNGANTNTGIIPAYIYGTDTISVNDRSVNSAYADACILNRIVSPLLGMTDFVFESNKYLSGTSELYGPGLRISKIINTDPYSKIKAITNYDYKNPTTGKESGVLVNDYEFVKPLPVTDFSHGNYYYYNCLLIQANPTSIGNFSGAPLTYEYVTVYNSDDVNATGKTVNEFSTYTLPKWQYPYFPIDDISWTAGNLLSQELYKVVSGTPTLVKKIVNTYSISSSFATIKGLSSAFIRVLIFTDPSTNDFTLANYYTYSKFQYLSQSDVYDYEQNSGTISSLVTQNFYYDNSSVHLFPTKMETTTSVSTDKIKKEFLYVADGASTGVNGVMKNLNMTGFPTQVTTYLVRSGTEYVTDYGKTDYFEWKTNKVYSKDFYSPKVAANTTKATFFGNPSGNTFLSSKINSYNKMGLPVESQVTGDQPNSMIVDKYFNQVVASANVASANQIAYSSFESKDFGNWKVSTGTQTTTPTVTLTLSRTFVSIPLTTSQTVNYTYSVTKSNGASPILTFSKDGTTPIERALTGASGSGSVSLTAGTWNVYLTYESNVSAVAANVTYSYTSPAAPNIVSNEYKTGVKAFQLSATQTISRDSLLSGTYLLSYYQKGGTVTATATGGASVLSTTTKATEADGWTLVQKKISIGGISQGIQLSGTSIYIDELRLHPLESFMTTTCYDVFKNVITKTDANAKSQFIEYDERRRVKLIRDHDKNILQLYDYTLAIN